MAIGPFFSVKQVYALNFGAFIVGVHLKLLSERESRVAGLDIEAQNLEALCADPMEGDARILHGMTASITPSFRGLDGTFKVEGRPESRLLPVVSAIGLKLYGTFEQLASSVDEGDEWSDWTRIRKVRTGTQPDTKAPIFQSQPEIVRLKVSKPTGDQTSDFETVTAEATARAGTLEPADVVMRGGESYIVTGQPETTGDFETAKLQLRAY